MRVDLHVHTTFSVDGYCTLRDLIKVAKQRGLDGVAITDHNTIEGHRAIRRIGNRDFVIIPGLEVSSTKGHIVALGVNELIPPGLSPAEAVEKIREQGGLAIAAHPFIIGRNPNLVYSARFDAIEILNGRAFFPANKLALGVAKRMGLVGVAGSDAHWCDEIGCVYTVCDADPRPDSVLECIRKGRVRVAGRPLSFPHVLLRGLKKIVLKMSARAGGGPPPLGEAGPEEMGC